MLDLLESHIIALQVEKTDMDASGVAESFQSLCTGMGLDGLMMDDGKCCIKQDKINGHQVDLAGALESLRSQLRPTRVLETNAAVYVTNNRQGEAIQEDVQEIGESSLGHQTSPSYNPGTRPCNRPGCKTCPFVSRSHEVHAPNGVFKAEGSFTCSSRNLIYAIICKRCGMVYIGETGRTLADRFSEHLRDVKKRGKKAVSLHFNSPDHHGCADMEVLGFRSCRGRNKSRVDCEQRLISKMGTLAPRGMNVQLHSRYKKKE
ncbi:hypothetical protein ElyMa_003991800 [Elysia marginata]|uniref:GIY-YIG domain-containing protein n=1 Tax=Elysia marginata TaxID=1093978 RepID=A0AAV4FYA7_9GAST|nr:hypothetical protein ElyMa_003991800 [Elysia marginata]